MGCPGKIDLLQVFFLQAVKKDEFFSSGRAVHHDIIVQLGGGFKYFLFSPVLGGK